MANAERGEVDLKVGDKIYTLRFSTNAIAAAEDLLDKEIGEIFKQLQAGRLGTVRALVFAGLSEHHPRISLLEAGELIDRDRDAVTAGIARAIELAFPPSKGRTENPPPASGAAG